MFFFVKKQKKNKNISENTIQMRFGPPFLKRGSKRGPICFSIYRCENSVISGKTSKILGEKYVFVNFARNNVGPHFGPLPSNFISGSEMTFVILEWGVYVSYSQDDP